jgi:hypothetical protein
MDNIYTPAPTRTVYPPNRNSVVSDFPISTKEPVKFGFKAGLNYNTVTPPVGHLRVNPDNLQVTDSDSMDFFTNYNLPFKLYACMVVRKCRRKSDPLVINVYKDFAKSCLGHVGIESKLIFMRGKYNARKTPTPIWRIRLKRKLIKSVRRIKNV